MASPDEKSCLSAPDLARRGGIAETTARRWIRRYGLGRKVGGRWRADPAQVAQFLKEGDGLIVASPPALDGHDDEAGEP